MKRRMLYIGLGIWILVSGCGTPGRNTLFQTSTIDALLAGVYDADLSCGDLLKHGDFGIGTFDRVDGEMVVLEGTIYQIKGDGKGYKADSNCKTPFATICHFNPEKTISIDTSADYKRVETLIDAAAPNQNLFCALRITGQFRSMKTRSVPAQKRPYPPLKEVTANQPEFDMNNVFGTIVGFRCPPYVSGINVPGYHLHFISRDRNQGGHVLSFEIMDGTCDIDILDQFFLRLPGTKGFAETVLSGDRNKELKDVERGKN
jgi:acetolactate decarboxylase